MVLIHPVADHSYIRKASNHAILYSHSIHGKVQIAKI